MMWMVNGECWLELLLAKAQTKPNMSIWISIQHAKCQTIENVFHLRPSHRLLNCWLILFCMYICNIIARLLCNRRCKKVKYLHTNITNWCTQFRTNISKQLYLHLNFGSISMELFRMQYDKIINYNRTQT